MMDIIIYHNPGCGTSRKTLAIIRSYGIEPRVIEYLENPPGRIDLMALIIAIGKPVRDLLRSKEALFEKLDLDNPKWTDEQLIGFMSENPVLMNRPIVVTPLGIRLCRPAEIVLDILPQPGQARMV